MSANGPCSRPMFGPLPEAAVPGARRDANGVRGAAAPRRRDSERRRQDDCPTFSPNENKDSILFQAALAAKVSDAVSVVIGG